MHNGKNKKTIKLVILLGAPLGEQNYERVGIPYLAPFFDVTVFNCMPWLGRFSNEVLCARRGEIGYITIDSESDFESAIENIGPEYAVDFVGRGSHAVQIQKILSRLGVKFVVQKTGALPVASLLTKISRLFSGAKTVEIRNAMKASNIESDVVAPRKINVLWTKINNAIAIRRHLIAPDVALLAGSKSLDYWTKKARQIIWIGSQDYYLFKSAQAKNREGCQTNEITRFVLFIDDCLPYASDWKLLNIEPPVVAASYYLSILKFFERIEKDFNLPVVIAAHPNGAEIHNYGNNFGGRQVISGQVNALVLESSLVLTHASTATSFAILARKPIIIITTAELRDSFYGASIENLAKSIRQKVLVVDELSNKVASIRLPQVNERLYRRYECNYLKNERSNEKTPWGDFIKYALSTTNPSKS